MLQAYNNAQRKYKYIHRSRTRHNARYRYTQTVQIGASTLFVYKLVALLWIKILQILHMEFEVKHSENLKHHI